MTGPNPVQGIPSGTYPTVSEVCYKMQCWQSWYCTRIHCAAGNLIVVVSRRDIAIVVIRQIDLFIRGRERVLDGSIPAPGVCGTSKKYHSTVFYNP